MFTDSEILLDVIIKCSQTQEKRLMIDLQVVRDAYQCHEILSIGFVRGPNNPADGMTKLGNCEPLVHLLRTGKANFEVEQWVLRLKNEEIRLINHLQMIIIRNSTILSQRQLQRKLSYLIKLI